MNKTKINLYLLVDLNGYKWYKARHGTKLDTKDVGLQRGMDCEIPRSLDQS